MLSVRIRNQRDGDGLAALHHACKQGHVDVVEELLRHDPDITLMDDRGRIAIEAACRGRQIHVVRYLLSHHGQDAREKALRAAARSAVFQQQYEVAELLLQHLPSDQIDLVGSRYGTSIKAAVAGSWNASDYPDYREVLRMVDLLLEHGTSPILRGGCYETALHAAACEAHIEVVKRLLQQPGVSIDWTDRIGRLTWRPCRGIGR